MIIIKIEKDDNVVNNISVKGHAKYADYGKDIVCAAVSSIVITTVNAILRIDENAITVKNDDFVEISVNTHDSVTNALLDNMIDLLIDLQKQYSKNIKINI